MSSMIKTKFGNAYLTPKGYYKVNNKFLHRLVFEDFYQINLDEEFDEPMVVHHIDEDKTNNEIWNLDIMPRSDHMILHKKGKPKSENHKINRSKSTNTSGFFRVYKEINKKYKQGFRWRYDYRENGKRNQISSVDLDGLKEKVIAKGLKWKVID